MQSHCTPYPGIDRRRGNYSSSSRLSISLSLKIKAFYKFNIAENVTFTKFQSVQIRNWEDTKRLMQCWANLGFVSDKSFLADLV